MKSTIKQVSEEFTCAVCCEFFDTPKTLSCLHTFCSACLEATEASRRQVRGIGDTNCLVECPLCRNLSKYAGGIKGIITNFVYKNIVEHLSVHEKLTTSSTTVLWCGKCQQNGAAGGDGDKAKPAVTYCYDCQAPLCDFCERMHEKTVDLADHHICSLEEIKQNRLPVLATSVPRRDNNLYLCRRHNDPIKLYCFTCCEVICRDCAIKKEDHRDHSYEFITDIIGNERVGMLGCMEPLVTMKTHFASCSNSIMAYQEELDRKQEQRSVQINCAVDEALQLLEERRGLLHNESHDIYKVMSKNAALQLEDIEMEKSSVESAAEFIRTTIEKGTDTEVMMYKKEIFACIDTLKQRFASYKSFEVGGTSAVHFAHNLKPVREFGSFCEVPDLQTSDAFGEGLNCPMQDKATNFVVQARGAKGKPLLRGGESCLVSITANPAPIGQVHVVTDTVTDNRDGTYNVSYRPTFPGVNHVAIRFDQQEIKGSPFRVNVKRNYVRPIGQPRVYPLPNASPLSVAMVTDYEIAVTASDSSVHVYNINGTKVNRIQADFMRPYGICADFANYLWITDSEAHTVQKYLRNDNGKFVKLFSFGSKGNLAGQFSYPKGVAVSPTNGFIYISDMRNNRIQIFKPELPVPRYHNSFGAVGKGPGYFEHPAGICFNKHGNLVVCDDHNCRLQEFDPEGTVIRTLGTSRSQKGLLCSPIGVTVDFHGRYIITEFGSHCVTFLNPNGEVLNCIKSVGPGYGQFVHPRGITVDSSGYLYVADSENMRIARF